jgi:hypothetical protein
MNVKNAKHDLNHCKATVVFIVATGRLSVHQFKQEKIVAKMKPTHLVAHLYFLQRTDQR